MKYESVSVRMLTGVIGEETMAEQHRQWILGVLYSAFSKTLGFQFFSLRQPNYRFQNIPNIVFAPLELSSQKLKYKKFGKAFTPPCTLN